MAVIRRLHGEHVEADAHGDDLLSFRPLPWGSPRKLSGLGVCVNVNSRSPRHRARRLFPVIGKGNPITTCTLPHLRRRGAFMSPPAARLRNALSDGQLMIPGAFNALTAKLAERLGYRAVYLSGGALSAGWAGVPDIGLLTLTEFT